MTDSSEPLGSVGAGYLSAVNRIVEPLVRAGLGSPGLLPTGLIVLETEGRRTGRLHRTPVVAHLVGARLLLSTIRGRESDWLRNLRANGSARYWLLGQPQVGEAIVFMPDGPLPKPEQLTGAARLMHSSLGRLTRDLGWGFALISLTDGSG